MEVSFPNGEQRARDASAATTRPRRSPTDLQEARQRAPNELPTLLYHIKPGFQAEVERECAQLKGVNLTVCALGDHFIL